MISQLRKRPPVGVVPRDHRTGLKWGRWLYLFFLLSFSGALLNHFVGSAFLLRADGLVLQSHFTIAPPFEASISTVFVQPGQNVKKGQALVQLESVALSRSLAEIAARKADITTRMAQAKSKLTMARRMLPIATQHHERLQSSLAVVEKLRDRNLTNGRRVEEALTTVFAARERMVELQAQSSGIAIELELLEKAYKEADQALSHLQRIYGDGRIVAPVDGVVGPTVASQGEMLVTGGRVMTIYSGTPFILAYIPDNYMFRVEQGQSVDVSIGSRKSIAFVEAVLPLADSLPPEFQNTFRPRDRSQLVRLQLPTDQGFATHQKVRVSQCLRADCRSLGAGWLEQVSRLAVRMQRATQLVERPPAQPRAALATAQAQK